MKNQTDIANGDAILSIERLDQSVLLSVAHINNTLPFGGVLPLTINDGHAQVVLRTTLLDEPDEVSTRAFMRPRRIALRHLTRTPLADFVALLPLAGSVEFDMQLPLVATYAATGAVVSAAAARSPIVSVCTLHDLTVDEHRALPTFELDVDLRSPNGNATLLVVSSLLDMAARGVDELAALTPSMYVPTLFGNTTVDSSGRIESNVAGAFEMLTRALPLRSIGDEFSALAAVDGAALEKAFLRSAAVNDSDTANNATLALLRVACNTFRTPLYAQCSKLDSGKLNASSIVLGSGALRPYLLLALGIAPTLERANRLSNDIASSELRTAFPRLPTVFKFLPEKNLIYYLLKTKQKYQRFEVYWSLLDDDWLRRRLRWVVSSVMHRR